MRFILYCVRWQAPYCGGFSTKIASNSFSTCSCVFFFLRLFLIIHIQHMSCSAVRRYAYAISSCSYGVLTQLYRTVSAHRWLVESVAEMGGVKILFSTIRDDNVSVHEHVSAFKLILLLLLLYQRIFGGWTETVSICFARNLWIHKEIKCESEFQKSQYDKFETVYCCAHSVCTVWKKGRTKKVDLVRASVTLHNFWCCLPNLYCFFALIFSVFSFFLFCIQFYVHVHVHIFFILFNIFNLLKFRNAIITWINDEKKKKHGIWL